MAARLLGRVDGHTNFATLELAVASGVTVTEGDFVYFSSGRVTNASIAGQQLIGVALGTATGNAGGTVKVLVCVDPLMRYVVDNDNAVTTFAATHVGTRFDLTGATGAQLVDTSSTDANSGQLLCIEYNPQIDPIRSDVSQGVFVISEHAFYPEGTAA